MKSAYIIVANSISNVLKTCIKMIDSYNNDIYILFDKKSKMWKYRNFLTQVIRKSQINFFEKKVNWGGYSQIDAVMTLLKEVCSSSEEYVYIHFLQGSDLPIKSQSEIDDFFSMNQGKEFVQIEIEKNEMAQNKCQFYHLFCHNRYFRKNKFVKVINFSLVAIQKKFNIRKNTDIDLYQGSALFSITKDFAKYLVNNEKEIKKRFRFSLAADECFVQTMIMKSPYKSHIYYNYMGETSNARLIDRTRQDGKNSPHIWRDNEYDFICNQDKDMCFARKFDEKIASVIVDKIYDHYTRKES